MPLTLLRTFLLTLLFCSGLAMAAPDGRNLQVGAAGEKRVALVIGNDRYAGVKPLEKAANDARAMEKALQQAGFRTQSVINGTRRDMNAAINRFVDDVSGGGIGVFFFAGHGVQLANQNFLIPVDIQGIEREADVADQSISLQTVQDKLADAKARFTLLVIDACRDNPLPRKAGRSVGASRGLAQASSAEGQIVVFAAGAHQQALDKLGPNDRNPNGVFTREFLPWIAKPGITIRDAVLGVRSAVRARARSVDHEQFPAIYDQAEGNFYFHPGRGGEIAALTPQLSGARTREQIEDELWGAIKDSEKLSVFEAYLAQYPNGRYVTLAKVRLLELRTPAAQRPATASAAAFASSDLSTPGTAFKDCTECPEMVVIPAGRFEMGSNNGDDDEKPIHNVRIARSFAMGKFEVTRGQFAAFVGASGYVPDEGCRVWKGKWEKDNSRGWRNPGYAQSDSHPVACVSWDDAKAYAAWLARKTGKDYRLPSEAEHEYATRAGSSATRPWGESPNDACRYANVADRSVKANVAGFSESEVHNCDDDHAHTAPTGRFKPNAFGLHDTVGNLWEWTEDCWNERYSGAPSDGSAWTSGNCGRHVLRGGSWDVAAQYARAAGRKWSGTTYRGSDGGFRLARTLP